MTVEVALAILYQDDYFLLQLRDDIPNIAAPGCWAFFGGHIEPGETPAEALIRELVEEINYHFTGIPVKFGSFPSDRVIRHIFSVPLLVPFSALKLEEGWDFALVTPAEVRQGERFSDIAKQVRPFSPPHQQILLDYIQQNPPIA